MVVLGFGGGRCGGKSWWMCVSFGGVLGSLGCIGFSPGPFGGGVGVVWEGRGVGGGRRVGFHSLHCRVFSRVEGGGDFVCLVWVRLPALGPRLWAGGLSVAVGLVVLGVVGMRWVWVGCVRVRCRSGGSSEGVCGVGDGVVLFGSGLGRLVS